MNKLIFANLLHRPLRSVISVLAVAIEVIMILSIVAIFMGMLERPERAHQRHRRRPDAAALERQLVQRAGQPVHAHPGREVLRKLPHVAVVSPAIQKISTSGNVEILYGIDYASFNALKPFIFLAGGKFQGPNDVIVDDVFAGGQNPATGKPYAVGDTSRFMDHPFRISGIVEQGKGGRKLIPSTPWGN